MSQNEKKCSLCLGRTMVANPSGGMHRCPACAVNKIPAPLVKPLVKEEKAPEAEVEIVKFRKKVARGKSVKKK